MKVILAGSRPPVEFRNNPHELENWYIQNTNHVADAMSESGYSVMATVIVCGKAQGFDTLGERWANLIGKSVDPYPADWQAYGKSAGPIRNRKMAEVGDALVAIQNSEKMTPGTANMVDIMRKLRKPVFVWNILTQKGTRY